MEKRFLILRVKKTTGKIGRMLPIYTHSSASQGESGAARRLLRAKGIATLASNPGISEIKNTAKNGQCEKAAAKDSSIKSSPKTSICCAFWQKYIKEQIKGKAKPVKLKQTKKGWHF